MKRRFVQDPVTLELLEVTDIPEPLRGVVDSALWGDRHYDGMRATDGADISTRTKHREYMHRTGLTTVDDFKGHFDRSVEKRREFLEGRATGSHREAIERAIHTLSQKGR